MPQLFRIGRLVVYFWSNENGEPVHVHVSEGTPSEHATKFWLTSTGGVEMAHNGSCLSKRELARVGSVIQANHEIVIERWGQRFGYVRYVDTNAPGSKIVP